MFDDVKVQRARWDAPKGIILSDGMLPEEFSMHTAETLRSGGPYAVLEPIFDVVQKYCIVPRWKAP